MNVKVAKKQKFKKISQKLSVIRLNFTFV